MTCPYWDVKALSRILAITPSTLYAWVAQGKMPYVKLNRLIRFRRDEIQEWMESHRAVKLKPLALRRRKANREGIDTVIARAKCDVYTGSYGRPDQDRAGKEGN